MNGFPLTHDIVLIGGGHAHALVLRRWGMKPMAGVRLTLINPGPTAPYSGMLPGHVAGHYSRAALDIDLVKLARFAGARLITGAADGIDTTARQVHVPGRPPIGFDLCSVDIGITSAMPALPGFAEHAIPAKPLGPFAARWRAYLAGEGPADVAVIGAGVAGAELAMAMAHALKERARPARVTLIDAGAALSALRPGSATKLRAAMKALGVTLLEQASITRITGDGPVLDDGTCIPAGFVVGAAGALPHPWLVRTGLATTDGFLDVSPTLQTSDPDIFAAGDCAHMPHAPRPKAGVFAVRQAPVIHDNLRARLTGAPLTRYKPQRDYLKLISLGGKSALGERLGFSPAGKLMWRWKDRIDQRFMDRFRDLPAMPAPALPDLRTAALDAAVGAQPFCGGCGAKVAQPTLAGVIGGVPDDAAILTTGGVQQVMSTDHLSAVTEDPVAMTRLAALHALGDIWAMGAMPQAATATLILPRMAEPMQARTLAEIMQTARATMEEAGATIVGGHTSMGDGLTVGFTVTGLCNTPPVTLEGARPGDALILTKPIGSGVIFASEMQGRAPGADVVAAWEALLVSQGAASRLLAGAHAMTDVTGFGLAGHLLGICAASGTAALVDTGAVPLLPGALALAESGVRSTLFPANRARFADAPDSPRADLMFDPQTAGGLLASVAGDQAQALIAALKAEGYPAAIIGEITEGPPAVTFR